MKCRTLIELDCPPGEEFPEGKIPAGTVIEEKDAWKLVRKGVAAAADEECEQKIPLSPEETRQRLFAYRKIAAGIQPEDREAWDRGWMRGYNPDGSWIPGPNADEYDELEYEEYKKESNLILP